MASVVDIVRREWLKLAQTLAGEAARTFLNRVLKLMYIEPGQFILELLQNAEDARMELGSRGGLFRVELWDDRVVVEHNGRPFNDRDVWDLCATRSSKKPSMGYKGYIGVGWKSVFKVSSRVEVYSGGMAFAFDKGYWREHVDELRELNLSPDDILWQVTPIPIRPPEHIDPKMTRFVIYLDDPSRYRDIVRTIDELKPSVFLFLEHINRIEVVDHVSGRSRAIEWFVRSEEEFRGVKVQEVTVNLYEGGTTRAERFVVFRGEFQVPDEVKSDRATIDAQRGDVVRREVAIAFALDPASGDLKPLEEGQFWGVYSFLPLHEVRSGLPFLIQADFIVHPGRRYINIEASWNRWLMSCIAEVVEVAIEYLARRFKYSYLSVFSYRDVGDEVYERLIRPTIVRVVEEQLHDPKVVCIEGHLVNLSSCVKAEDDVLELVKRGLIAEGDLRHVYGTERHILDPKVRLRPMDRVETLGLVGLLSEGLIASKLKEDFNTALRLLAEVYRVAYSRKIHVPHDRRLIVTASGGVRRAHEVYLCKLSPEVEELVRRFPEAERQLEALEVVHEGLANALGDEVLKWLGVREVSLSELCREALLPKISTEAPKPGVDELLAITAILVRSRVCPDRPVWAVTMSGEVKRSDEVYYPLEHFTEIDGYVDVFKGVGVEFLDVEKYLKYVGGEGPASLKQFFSRVVKGLSPCEYRYPRHFIHNDYKVIVRNIRELLENSSRDVNVRYVRALKHLYHKVLRACWDEPIAMKVVTDKGSIVDSTQCMLHDAYSPRERWAKWRDEGFNIGPFIALDYIKDPHNLEEASTWREFLTRALGVREEASREDVERFAEWFVERRLRGRGFVIEGRRGEGYDLMARRGDEVVYVEVKGRRELRDDVELSPKETEVARKYGDKYWLVVVADIPNDPKAYLVRDPSRVQEKVIVPARTIRERGELL